MKKNAGQSLIGIIVSMVILVGLGLAFAVGTGVFGSKDVPERADGQGETVVGRSLLAGKDTECRNNLGQMRTSIQIGTDPVSDTPPSTLQATGMSSQFMSCPVGEVDYVYDPSSGKVSCPHPGHESY